MWASNNKLRNSLAAKSLTCTFFSIWNNFIHTVKYSNMLHTYRDYISMHIILLYLTHKPFIGASFIYTTSLCHWHVQLDPTKLIDIAWRYIWKVHWNSSTAENFPLITCWTYILIQSVSWYGIVDITLNCLNYWSYYITVRPFPFP